MKTLRALAIFALAAISVAATYALPAPRKEAKTADVMAAARAAANGDPLLEALLTELERSKTQLKMDQVPAPYYIEYRVSDIQQFIAEAAFGALRQRQNIHVRLLRVVVRVGDYKQDSYFGQGMGETTILPLDNDPIAIRRQIWLATDEAYKNAGEALTEKQAILKQFTADDHPVDDFAKAPVTTLVEPTVSLTVNADEWTKTLEEATNLFRTYPDVQSLSASARFSAVNEYLVNSEGTVNRSGKNVYSVTLQASTQAPDGMRLERSPDWTVGKVAELPTREKLLSDTRETLDTLTALRKAPIVEEEYRGPVLFAPDAANDVVAALIGQNILGRKPQLGAPNRTTGAFATSYKSRVLPTFLDVIDDPTMKEFEGKSLVGSYDVDAEGVKAQPVNVVEKGILTDYLIGRQPIRDFPESNGHGRAGAAAPPNPGVGVLLLKSSEAESPSDLRKKIVQMAVNGDMPYVYRVETLGGLTPRLLYRVYAKDGHEELVRGAVFNELDLRAMRSDLSAVGNDPLVSNREAGLPMTIISPSLLFDELEVKRANTSKDKLPEYPPPPLAK
ncbi:MAG TPA: metallopeptidase TldD-related protein [Candidatus Acidoferrum sp.]|nr:metallopeptidase TldD-related protein [Candidatus Acidoferrum sp.]